MNAETKLNVPIITSETTEFPAGGASVRVGKGVTRVNGLDHGELSGRGIRVVVNVESRPVIDPKSGIVQDDARVSTPVINRMPPVRSHFSV